MGWDDNIYYNTPEPWRIVAEHDWADSYAFDTLLVFRNEETGELRAAWDSGCSCPVPFEDYEGMGDATRVRSVDDLRDYVVSERGYVGGTAYGESDENDPGWCDVKAAVHRALARA